MRVWSWSRGLAIAVATVMASLACGCLPWDGRPTKDDAAYREGMRQFLAGRHSEAKRHLESFLAKGPRATDAADAHYTLGAIALRAGEAQEATRHFSAALRSPRNDDVLVGAELGLARAQFLKGEYRQCRATCEDLLGDDRFAARADELLMLLAESTERAGLHSEAQRYYQQLVRRFPSSPLADRARQRLGEAPGSVTPTAPPSMPPATPIGRFSVQVAALGSASKAEALRRRLSAQGYPALVKMIRAGSRSLHAVRVGSYRTEGEAKRAAAQLKRAGHSTIIKP